MKKTYKELISESINYNCCVDEGVVDNGIVSVKSWISGLKTKLKNKSDDTFRDQTRKIHTKIKRLENEINDIEKIMSELGITK